MGNRDTQFQGFAKVLWKELEDHPYVELGQLQDCDRVQLYRVIARHAYDLVTSAVGHTLSLDADSTTTQEIIESVPDMPELPKEPK